MRHTAQRLLVMLLTVLVALEPYGHAVAATAGSSAAPAANTASIANETPWPRTVKSGDTTLTVYTPQLDAWDGATLSARVAVQAQVGGKQPQTHFGILVLEARTLTDKGARVVTIDHALVQTADFPSISPSASRAWADAIAHDLGGKSTRIALDLLEAQLAITGAAKAGAGQPLRNDAPAVIFSRVPAILISIDGAPAYRAMAGLPFERVINTRPLLLRDAGGMHYLRIFDGWMGAPSLGGPWTVVASPTSAMASALKQASDAHLIDPLTGQAAKDQPAPSLRKTVPAVYTATSPTELIVTDGEPKYVPVAGTRLLYVENTTGHIFNSGADNKTYVLLSGRWFRAAGERGPWEYVAANALPADFAGIPDDSPVENVKASIAGTEQAREAAAAVMVPQAAVVALAGTALTPPRFDGDPQFRPVAGTALQYAVNTSMPILLADNDYYALQNGVWFRARSVRGPWSVATAVPPAIYTIPPSSPLYYVTFVRIYTAGSSTVYVGFTPGYQGSYIDPATGVVVYGTGYVYDPWTSAYWYGTPVTYGYGAAVAYTPWSGWAVAFGMGWFWGAATVAWGWGWGSYPYWGPWAYPAWGGAWGPRGGAVAWGSGGWAGYSGNIYTQWGNRAGVTRVAGGFDAWTGNRWAGQVGASYNSRTGIASAGQRGAVGNIYTGNYAAGARGVATGPRGNAVVGGLGTAGNAYSGKQVSGYGGAVYNKDTGQWTRFGGATGANGGHVGHVGDDVYAGKDGNVYRNGGEGWQKYTPGGGWQPTAGSAQGQATRNATGGLGAAEHPQHLDPDRVARQAGNERAAKLRDSSAGMSRSFGRGGGMRRR